MGNMIYQVIYTSPTTSWVSIASNYTVCLFGQKIVDLELNCITVDNTNHELFQASWNLKRAINIFAFVCNRFEFTWRLATNESYFQDIDVISLLVLASNENLHVQHEKNVENLFRTMLSSRNPAVSCIAMRALHSTVGIWGRNRAFPVIEYTDGLLILDPIIPPRYTVGSENDPARRKSWSWFMRGMDQVLK